MERDEARLFDLLENKTYEQLTETELELVSEFLTEREYRSQQQLILMADAVEEGNAPVPLPLQLSISPQKHHSTLRVYQGLLAAACVGIIILLLRPDTASPQQVIVHNTEKPASELKVVHDTVVEYITQVDTVEIPVRTKRDELVVSAQPASPESVLSFVENETMIPDLNVDKIRTTGNSMKEDRSAGLLPAQIYSGN